MNKLSKNYYKAYYRVIEQDLYTYELMKRNIEKCMEEIAITEEYEPSPSVSTNKPEIGSFIVGSISDPTLREALKCIELQKRYKKVMQLYSAIGFYEMVRRIETIDWVIDRLKKSNIGNERLKAEVIKKRYFEHRLTVDGIALEMSLGQKTIYRWCEDVIKEIGMRLGFEIK